MQSGPLRAFTQAPRMPADAVSRSTRRTSAAAGLSARKVDTGDLASIQSGSAAGAWRRWTTSRSSRAGLTAASAAGRRDVIISPPAPERPALDDAADQGHQRQLFQRRAGTRASSRCREAWSRSCGGHLYLEQLDRCRRSDDVKRLSEFEQPVAELERRSRASLVQNDRRSTSERSIASARRACSSPRTSTRP